MAFSLTLLDLRGGADLVQVLGRFDATYLLGSGNDTIEGSVISGDVSLGLGDDLLDLENATGHLLEADIAGDAGNDVIVLANYVSDAFNFNDVDRGTGNDAIQGLVISGRFLGGEGDDVIDLQLNPLSGTAFLSSGLGGDIVKVEAAPAATDTGRAVRLDGGDGSDAITGTDYAATKVHDRFEFSGLWGLDEVTGFDVGQDRLVFRANGIGPETLGDLQFGGQGTGLQINFGTQSIWIYGVTLGAFEMTDIQFL